MYAKPAGSPGAAIPLGKTSVVFGGREGGLGPGGGGPGGGIGAGSFAAHARSERACTVERHGRIASPSTENAAGTASALALPRLTVSSPAARESVRLNHVPAAGERARDL